MVVGLLRGLGKRFEKVVTIERTAGREQGLDHDRFAVSWS
jgi:hypothetical protein